MRMSPQAGATRAKTTTCSPAAHLRYWDTILGVPKHPGFPSVPSELLLLQMGFRGFNSCNTEKSLQMALLQGEPDPRALGRMKNRATSWPTGKISNSSPSFLHALPNLKPEPFPEPGDRSSFLQAEKLRGFLLLFCLFLRNGYKGMPLFLDIATHFPHLYNSLSYILLTGGHGDKWRLRP